MGALLVNFYFEMITDLMKVAIITHRLVPFIQLPPMVTSYKCNTRSKPEDDNGETLISHSPYLIFKCMWRFK